VRRNKHPQPRARSVKSVRPERAATHKPPNSSGAMQCLASQRKLKTTTSRSLLKSGTVDEALWCAPDEGSRTTRLTTSRQKQAQASFLSPREQLSLGFSGTLVQTGTCLVIASRCYNDGQHILVGGYLQSSLITVCFACRCSTITRCYNSTCAAQRSSLCTRIYKCSRLEP
jgi:hypothetical protein